MVVAAAEKRMAKKVGRPGGGREYGTIKVDQEILRKARHLAAEERLSMTEYVNRLVTEAIEKPYSKYLKKREEEANE